MRLKTAHRISTPFKQKAEPKFHMKIKFHHFFLALALLAGPNHAAAQGTAFTYSGKLNAGATPASGSFDLTFTVFDSDQPGGNLIAGPLTNSATAVTNGLFTATIDFGAGIFTGTNYWLEIGVQTNGGSGFTTLAPRQPLTPTPYAIFASTASNVVGTVSSGSLAGEYGNVVALDNPGNSFGGTFTGDGTSMANVDAVALNGLTSANFWNTGGNAGANPTNGAFLGTTDNLPLEFWVNTNRALRLEYAQDVNYGGPAPNLIGGYAGNVVSNGVCGGFIGGGGNHSIPNRVGGDYASVLGGLGNIASGDYATALGQQSTASGIDSTCLGAGSKASGYVSTALGLSTTASGDESTALGYKSIAAGQFSLAAGYYAYASYYDSFVWADGSSDSYFEDSVPNQFLIRASGGVGIGTSFTPPGGLDVASGGLAVTGTSSPNYPGAKGVFIESEGTFGAMFAFDYTASHTLPLCLNTPGGNVGIGTTTPAALLQVGSATCDGTTWVNASDRNIKRGFAAISPREVLAKVSAMPITEWQYKVEADGTKHIGPMAQDFHAAFGLNGADDKHISTVDEGGVALAAIQGLDQKLEATQLAIKSKDKEIQDLKQQNGSLGERLNELEAIVKRLAAQK